MAQPSSDIENDGERGRRPLFVTLAQHALARGQGPRAAIHLLEGVRRRPETFAADAQRDAILAALAQAVRGPGLEPELLAVEAVIPGFLGALFAALETVGCEAVVASIERAMALATRERGTRWAFERDDDDDDACAEPSRQAATEPPPAWHAVPLVAPSAPLWSDAASDELAVPPEPGPPRSYAPSGGRPRFARLTPVPLDDLEDPPSPPRREPVSYVSYVAGGASATSADAALEAAAPATEPGRSRETSGDWRSDPALRSLSSAGVASRSVPVGVSNAWLRERLGGDDAALRTPPPLEAVSSAVETRARREAPEEDGEAEGGFGFEHEVRERLTLHRMATADELLSYAAAAADDEPRQRRVRTHGAMIARLRRPRRRRRLSLGLLFVVLVCAAAALLPIAWDSLSESWHSAALEGAEASAARGTRGGLLDARRALVDELAERPEGERTPGLALVVDRLLVHRYGEVSEVELDASALEDDPLARLALVMDALAADDAGLAAQVVAATADSVWSAEPGTQAWARGLVAAAQGEVEAAASQLAAAADEHALARLALLDLAELALSTGHRTASAAFVERARGDAAQHPFVALALRLLTTDPMAFEATALLPSVVRAESLSLSQQGWYWLARGYQSMRAGELESATAAVEQGRAVSPGNGQLAFLAGVIALREGRVTEAASALAWGTSALGQSARGRRFRGHVAELLSESGRPDLVLQLLEYRAQEPAASLTGRLAVSDLALLADALTGLGRSDEALAVVEAASAGEHASLVLRRCALLHGAGRSEEAAAVYGGLRVPAARQGCALYAVLGTGRFEEALAAADALTASQPGEQAPLLTRAELLSLAGRGEEAAVLIEERMARELVGTRAQLLAALHRSRAGTLSAAAAEAACALEVTDLALLLAQAEIALASGMPQRARAALERADAMEPNHARIAALRGVHLERGHDEHRLALLRQGREGHLSLPGLYLELGRVHAARGEAEAALEALSMAMQRPQLEAQAVAEAAGVYDTAELRASGRRKLTALLDAIPTTAETRTLRGRLAFQVAMLYRPSSGTYEAARFLKRARVLLGEQPEIHFQLGEYFTANKMPVVARKHYEQAHAIDPSFPVPAS